jgi:hypothetical protein
MVDRIDLFDAIVKGAEESRYGKDPLHPEAPGSLTRFLTAIADKHPQVFVSLLGELLQQEVQAELSIEARRVEKRLQ